MNAVIFLLYLQSDMLPLKKKLSGARRHGGGAWSELDCDNALDFSRLREACFFDLEGTAYWRLLWAFLLRAEFVAALSLLYRCLAPYYCSPDPQAPF